MMSETRTVRAAAWMGIVLPVVVTAVGIYMQLSWWDELPDPIAVHWGASGVVDGFGSKALIPWATALLGLAMSLMLTIPVLVVLRKGTRGPNLRFMVAIAAFFAVFMVLLLTGSIHIQRGLADAADTGSIGPVLLWSFAAGALAGAVAWIVQPRQEFLEGAEEVAAIPVEPTERAVWTRRVGMTFPIILVIGIGAVGCAVGAVVLWFKGGIGPAWLLGITALLIGILAFGLTSATVTVDDRGLAVKAALGWPRFVVPIDDVASVATKEISGLAEFGGFGFRAIPGALGVILKSGDAISVTRQNGRRFVVTVDDAATGAGLLQAFVSRRV